MTLSLIYITTASFPFTFHTFSIKNCQQVFTEISTHLSNHPVFVRDINHTAHNT